MTVNSGITLRLQFLARVVRKECQHLATTDQRLFASAFTYQRPAGYRDGRFAVGRRGAYSGTRPASSMATRACVRRLKRTGGNVNPIGIRCSHDKGKDTNWNGNVPDSASSNAPYRIYNIGNEQPVELLRYIEVLEQCLGRKAQMEMLPLQAGDVPDTGADVPELIIAVSYRPQVPVEEGVANFGEWYRNYYGVQP